MAALEGKGIVIIGGTTGLGLSSARACVAAGARVIVVGRKLESVRAAEAELGSGARALSGDATDPETAPAAIAACVAAFGSFDGLYHVAGGSGRRRGDGPLDAVSDEGWRLTIDLNLTSLFLSNRAAVRQLLTQGGGGSVLNMGSVLGARPSAKYFSTYSYAAAKAAVIGMTKTAAAQYAAQNIRFNAIAPAVIETPMSERAQGDDRIMSFIATKQPLGGGRIGVPEDLDAAVVFFLSDASRFVTGQVLTVDGGWSVSDGQYAE